MVNARNSIALAVMPLALASCSSAAVGPSTGVPGVAPVRTTRTANARKVVTGSPIQHVIFVIQENRTLNDLFLGFPGAFTQAYGYDEQGAKVPLRAQSLSTTWDISHDSKSFFAACDGGATILGRGVGCKMDAWDQEGRSGGPSDAPYAYVPHKEIKPYWALAKQYVLADRMFTSSLDASFVAHQYAIAAYASTAVDFPFGAWGCSGGDSDMVSTLKPDRTYGPQITPCFDNPTIGSEADAAGASWRYYTGAVDGDGGVWSAYQAINPIYNGPDWAADVVNPPSQFLTDIAAGQLANITWITPTLQASDHAGIDKGNDGPGWVASIVDAVGASSFWNTTAIFIMWDDWGGWYDPVPPPYADYDGLGFRVPLIVVSPYAKQRYVTHVQYETASVLRYIEDNFGLPQLARSDARAADPVFDVFDYGQKARRFTKIVGAKPITYWRNLERASPYHGLPKAILGDD